MASILYSVADMLFLNLTLRLCANLLFQTVSAHNIYYIFTILLLHSHILLHFFLLTVQELRSHPSRELRVNPVKYSVLTPSRARSDLSVRCAAMAKARLNGPFPQPLRFFLWS